MDGREEWREGWGEVMVRLRVWPLIEGGGPKEESEAPTARQFLERAGDEMDTAAPGKEGWQGQG